MYREQVYWRASALPAPQREYQSAPPRCGPSHQATPPLGRADILPCRLDRFASVCERLLCASHFRIFTSVLRAAAGATNALSACILVTDSDVTICWRFFCVQGYPPMPPVRLFMSRHGQNQFAAPCPVACVNMLACLPLPAPDMIFCNPLTSSHAPLARACTPRLRYFA